MKKGKMIIDRVLIIIVLIFGIASVMIGFGYYYENEQFKKGAIKTQGTIVEFEERKRSYIPIFIFYDINNNQVKLKANISTSPPIGRIGDSVKVIYQKDNPEGARIEIFWLAILPLVGFGGFGLFVIFIAFSQIKRWGTSSMNDIECKKDTY